MYSSLAKQEGLFCIVYIIADIYINVEEVSRQIKIDAREIVKRVRENNRSMFRKLVAALAHHWCGIPIIEIARSCEIGRSSVSRMPEEGEGYARENKIVLMH